MKDLVKEHLIYIFIILLLAACLFSSVRSCSSVKSEYKNNIEALYDSINVYKSKNGELVASKKILEGDIDLLKVTNEDLYKQLQDMNVKKPEQVVKIETVIERTPVDTVWVIDSTKVNLTKQFTFNDKWRTLEGKVNIYNNKLGLQFTKDETYADYTLAIKNNTVYVTSNNPYIKFKDISGLTLPKQKKPKWGLTVGPSIFSGVVNNKLEWGFGISATFGWTPISF